MKILFTIFLMVCIALSYAQTTYIYPLKQDFKAQQTEAPDLIVIPNNESLTGEFVERDVPETTCGQGGTAPGYFFEDDAGLQFNNPQGFIDQTYTLAFNMQIDEFITPPSWVRLFSFTHEDDVGVYIKLTGAPDHGTLEFWPHGTVGEWDFFSPVDFYQLILVRDDQSLIRIYVNGQEFATYNDATTQAYVPQPPNNYIVFFRDSPSVLANEASPGFVSLITLANYAWSAQAVQDYWNLFCSNLLGVSDPVFQEVSLYPNPATEVLFVKLMGIPEEYRIEVMDICGNLLMEIQPEMSPVEMDVSLFHPGFYLVRVTHGRNSGYYKFVKN